jgi:hypothetical protein
MRSLAFLTCLVLAAGCPAPTPNVNDTDGGAPGDDGGAPEGDGGTPEDDAGAPEDDAGAPEDDGGAPEDDAGAPEDDAGGSQDAGYDAGYDAGAPPPPFDAGPIDPPVRDGFWSYSVGGPITAFTTSFQITDSQNDDLVLVVVVTSPYSPTIANTGVSGLAAQTTTELEAQRSARDQTGIEMWSLEGPQGNGAISVQLSYDTDAASLIAVRYRNVNGTGAVGVHSSANTNGENGAFPIGTDNGSYALAVPGADRGSMLVTGVATYGQAHGFGAGFAEVTEVQAGNASSALQEGIVLIPPVTTRGTFAADTDWAIAVVEVVGP